MRRLGKLIAASAETRRLLVRSYEKKTRSGSWPTSLTSLIARNVTRIGPRTRSQIARLRDVSRGGGVAFDAETNSTLALEIKKKREPSFLPSFLSFLLSRKFHREPLLRFDHNCFVSNLPPVFRVSLPFFLSLSLSSTSSELFPLTDFWSSPRESVS